MTAPEGSFDDAAAPLLRQLTEAPYGSRSRQVARAQLVERYMPLAEAVARRFTRAGRSAADVTQIAAVALVGAIDRAGPDLAGRMTSYLVTSIAGELLMHGEEPVAGGVTPTRPQTAPTAPAVETPRPAAPSHN